jgi:glyoxylase-like metal-dependent hydrolase (beta-lactamase superfamily II)
MHTRATIVSLAIASSIVWAAEYPVVQGKTYKFEKIAEGVYYATGGFGSNNVVIVNDNDVMLVDDGTTPATARAFLQDVKMLTDKPVRYVVNTHFHYDHTDGNSVFPPNVEIIGHEYVRNAILTFDVLHREPYKTSQTALPAQIESLKKQVADEKDAGRKAPLQKQLATAQTNWEQLKEVKAVAPNVTYASKLTLHKGQRDIQLLFLGRGHTGGDTVVFLPKEGIVCTGDLMESRIAYMGDAFFDEWITTLDALKKLDFKVDLPGHGVPFTDKGLITAFQSYITDITKQAAALRKQGVSADDAATRVNLTSHSKEFPQITGPGAEVRGVRRIYAWMDERGNRPPLSSFEKKK